MNRLVIVEELVDNLLICRNTLTINRAQRAEELEVNMVSFILSISISDQLQEE